MAGDQGISSAVPHRQVAPTFSATVFFSAKQPKVGRDATGFFQIPYSIIQKV
jgi:hypothetical protein